MWIAQRGLEAATPCLPIPSISSDVNDIVERKIVATPTVLYRYGVLLGFRGFIWRPIVDYRYGRHPKTYPELAGSLNWLSWQAKLSAELDVMIQVFR